MAAVSEEPVSPENHNRLSKAEKKKAKQEAIKDRRRETRKCTNKRQRSERAEKRQAMLQAMTTEERIAFIRKERDAEGRNRRLEEGRENGRLKVCIALEFMDAMSEKERKSLAKQIQYIMNTITRGETYSVKLSLAPFLPGSDFEKDCAIWGLKNWRVNFLPHVYTQGLTESDLTKTIVLSPDADRDLTLEELQDDENIFIIGGLIDRSVVKYKTLEYSEKHKLECRRLPLEEAEVRMHPILNVNTVFDILACVKFDGLSWREALAVHAPPRKLGTATPKSKRRKHNPTFSSDGDTLGTSLESPPPDD